MSLTLTNTETEMYSGAVLYKYQHLDYFGTNTMTFFGSRPTETVNVPIVQQGDAENLDDGSNHDGTAEIASIQITLDAPLKSYNTVKKSQVDVRPDLNYLRNLGTQHGKNVGRGRTIRILNYLSTYADGQSNVVDIDAGGLIGGDAPSKEVKDGIKNIAALMDADGVDPMDRCGMLRSTEFYELSDADGVMSLDFGGQANRQTIGGNMSNIGYLNFVIKNCGLGFGTNWDQSQYETTLGFPSDQAFDMTNVIGVFWQKDAFAVRHQTVLETTAEWIAEKQVWLLMARLHMGIEAVHPEGIYVLRNDPSIS